jgi:ADP-ribose pyrophosphatase YjhB (NUDIX family)
MVRCHGAHKNSGVIQLHTPLLLLQVGVGAIVVNSQQEMLVVQEANGPLRGQDFWKMPTGLVHEGEDLIDAVEREVLEETGVR